MPLLTAMSTFERLPCVLRRHNLLSGWRTLVGKDSIRLNRTRGELFGYTDMRDGFLRLIVIDQVLEKDFFALADAMIGEGCGAVGLPIGAHDLPAATDLLAVLD